MEWKTSLSKSDKDETLIRGYELKELMKNVTFTEAIFLLLKGELPNKNERAMLDAIFVSSIDHGINPPSIIAARSVASSGNSLNTAVAAGISAIGDYHGGAIEKCAKLLSETTDPIRLVKESLENKQKLPGYGHKIYTEDPRTKTLFDIAKQNNLLGRYCKLALEIENELEKQKGKKLCLNVDGAIAALILEMGFPWTLGKAFFIISRVAGISAHVHEELTTEKPFRRLEDSKYTGEDRRGL